MGEHERAGGEKDAAGVGSSAEKAPWLHCAVMYCSGVASPAHSPCCSTHANDLCCRHYRRSHFVEVRPCCETDARNLPPAESDEQGGER